MSSAAIHSRARLPLDQVAHRFTITFCRGVLMKIVSMIARVLLGLIFAVFGANHVLHFIPTGPMPTGAAGPIRRRALIHRSISTLSVFFEVGPAILLLAQQVCSACTYAGGSGHRQYLFFSTHLMDPKGMPMAALSILWLLVFLAARLRHFAGIFQQRVAGLSNDGAYPPSGRRPVSTIKKR